MTSTQRIALGVIVAGGLGVAGGYALRAHAEGAPRTQPLFYRGTLVNADGSAATGSHKVKVTLHDSETTGAPLCASAESAVDVTASRGQFRIPLAGGSGDCVAVVHQNAELWVGVTLDGSTTATRPKLGAVPYALESDHALTAK